VCVCVHRTIPLVVSDSHCWLVVKGDRVAAAGRRGSVQ